MYSQISCYLIRTSFLVAVGCGPVFAQSPGIDSCAGVPRQINTAGHFDLEVGDSWNGQIATDVVICGGCTVCSGPSQNPCPSVGDSSDIQWGRRRHG